MASSVKRQCLFLCSAHPDGTNAHSFIHFYTLASASFNVHLVTPEGQPVIFVNLDEESAKWVSEFKMKTISTEQRLETVNANRYDVLMIPSGLGALYDLVSNEKLCEILLSFIAMQKPICACGYGVAGLMAARKDKQWAFKGFSITAPKLSETVKLSNFSKLPLILSETILDNGGHYAEGMDESLHVVIDRHLITAQNDKSALLAAQNLLIMISTRYSQRTK